MEAFAPLIAGFQTALSFENLVFVFIGVLLGTLIGMLPGIGPINGIAILIPITFALDINPTTMLILCLHARHIPIRLHLEAGRVVPLYHLATEHSL